MRPFTFYCICVLLSAPFNLARAIEIDSAADATMHAFETTKPETETITKEIDTSDFRDRSNERKETETEKPEAETHGIERPEGPDRDDIEDHKEHASGILETEKEHEKENEKEHDDEMEKETGDQDEKRSNAPQ